MKCINKIENIKKFIVEGENVYFRHGNEIFFNRHLIKKLDNNFFGQFYVNNGELIIQSYLGNFECNDSIYKGYYNYSNTQKISFLSTVDNSMYIFEGQLQVRIGLTKQYHQFENKAIIFDDSKIQAYSLPTAQPLWQYDLSELVFYSDSDKKEYSYEVKAFIGIIGTSLFIKLNNNEILVLDIHSGILKEKLSFIDKMIGESSIRRPDADMPFFKTKYIIDEKASLIQALFVDLYYEIEHKNDKSYTTVFGLKNEYEKYGINPEYTSDDNVVLGDKLYFMIQDQSRFAVLNTNSKLIEYVSEPIMIENREDRFSKLKEIQVSEDKVYVLASDNTLHIFQKENRS